MTDPEQRPRESVVFLLLALICLASVIHGRWWSPIVNIVASGLIVWATFRGTRRP
jgi:hypothetical protein